MSVLQKLAAVSCHQSTLTAVGGLVHQLIKETWWNTTNTQCNIWLLHIDLLPFSTKLHKWGKNPPDLEVYGWTQFQWNIKIYFRVNETNHRPHYSSFSQLAFTNIYHFISPESILDNFLSIGLGGDSDLWQLWTSISIQEMAVVFDLHLQMDTRVSRGILEDHLRV